MMKIECEYKREREREREWVGKQVYKFTSDCVGALLVVGTKWSYTSE